MKILLCGMLTTTMLLMGCGQEVTVAPHATNIKLDRVNIDTVCFDHIEYFVDHFGSISGSRIDPLNHNAMGC